MDDPTWQLHLPVAPTSVARARDFVARLLTTARHAGIRDDACLIVSELATNAVRHARTPYTLAVARPSDGLLLVVDDGSCHRPARGGAEPFASQGAGLLLVEELSSAWGVIPTDDGKAVWAWVSVDPEMELGDGAGGPAPRGRRAAPSTATRPSVPARSPVAGVTAAARRTPRAARSTPRPAPPPPPRDGG